MNAKQLVITAPYTVEMIDKFIEEPNADEVQVRLSVSTISSGTERANLVGEININSAKILTEAFFPRYIGYSSSGIIEKVGKNVTELKVGDRVALSWSVHGSLQNINKANVHKIIDDTIPFEEAALWHISTFPMAAIRKCKFEIGESAIVMGVGVLGILGIKQLISAGAAPVIAVDPNEDKRNLALSIGADYAFDPYDKEFSHKVKEVTNGGCNVALEVTGVGAGLDGVLDCMAPFGRVALLGCTRNSDFTIDYYHKVHAKGVSLIGAHTIARPKTESSSGMWTTKDDVYSMQKLYKYGKINLSSLVEEMHSPYEFKEVYHRLATQPSFPIVQFDWRMYNE